MSYTRDLISHSIGIRVGIEMENNYITELGNGYWNVLNILALEFYI
jgi:hypothetical protein